MPPEPQDLVRFMGSSPEQCSCQFNMQLDLLARRARLARPGPSEPWGLVRVLFPSCCDARLMMIDVQLDLPA